MARGAGAISGHKYLSDFAQKYYEEGRARGKAEAQIEGRLEAVLEGRLEGRREGKLEGRLEGRILGRIEGAREALLKVLTARDLALGDDHRARMAACSDLAALHTWLVLAAQASTAAEVFWD